MPTSPGGGQVPPASEPAADQASQQNAAEPVEPPVERPTVRVILLDPADRVLLFRSRDLRSGETLWYPPGGGVEGGESTIDAAIRELWEETGLTAVTLGPELWRRERLLPYRGAPHLFRERHFLGRTTRDTIDTSGFSAEERALILEHRWWTLTELAAAGERLVPLDLADLLAWVLTYGPPDAPWSIDT